MSYIEQKQIAAGKTLEKLGYTWQGGELWKPPLGANPLPLLTRIDQLQAEVEALRKDAAWQPIETAPKEGEFLVFMPTNRSPIQLCTAHKNCTVIGNCFAFDLPKPTHWMHRPKPPTAEVVLIS